MAVIIPQRTGKLERIQCFFQRNGFHRQSLCQLRKTRFFLIIGSTNLNNRTETTDLNRYRLTAYRICSQYPFTHLMLSLRVNGLIYQRMEAFIETVHHASPFLFSFRHFIELFLHIRCKVKIHDFRKVFHQEIVYHDTGISRQQLGLFISRHLCLGSFRNLAAFQFQDIIRAFHTFTVSFFYITALLHSRNGRCICRWTTDAQLFQFAYQAGFRITGRTLGKALSRQDFFSYQFFPFAQRRQQTALVFLLIVIIV